jgi:hypothetical protein
MYSKYRARLNIRPEQKKLNDTENKKLAREYKKSKFD